jgi:hypothetical protein
MMMLEKQRYTGRAYRVLDRERLSAQVNPSDPWIMATFHH